MPHPVPLKVKNMTIRQQRMLLRILITLLCTILVLLLPLQGIWKLLCYLALYLFIGYDVLRKTLRHILLGKIFTETFLMSIATIGAFVLALLTDSGDYFEAVAVMFFFQVGEWFESWAVDRSRKNIAALMDIRPDTAHLEREGEILTLHPEQVEVGSIVQVYPGEKVPLDGVVISGTSALHTAALTGESLPRDVQPGDSVPNGAVNLSGLLRIRTQVPFSQSTAARILQLVENAAGRKAKAQHFISRFSAVYTPVVCLLALAIGLVPGMICLIGTGTAHFIPYVYRALTFLVISCPCALVISVPLTFFSAIGGAGRQGVLVKGANYLEALARTGTMVFDKTGTLTKGSFEVTDIHSPAMEKENLLSLAAHAEYYSSHPISRSLMKAYGKEVDPSIVQNVREESGCGVLATIEGKEVAVGNDKLMKKLGVSPPAMDAVGTLVHIAVNQTYQGTIVIADTVKPTAQKAMETLYTLGIKNTVMLSGDRHRTADHIAHQLHISKVEAELLPHQKVEKLEEILDSKGKRENVAFVGDGINDAPALTRADVGIAMGGMGSDAAIEAADVVLMQDDPMQICTAIRISRRCMAIVWQNILFSLFVKLLCLLLSALGTVNMGLAIFADVGVMVLAVLNATRALSAR